MALKKLYNVNTTVISDRQVRVPDKYSHEVDQYTQQEVDTRTEGSLPYQTLVGPIGTLQE